MVRTIAYWPLPLFCSLVLGSASWADEPEPLPTLRALWKSQHTEITTARIRFQGYRNNLSEMHRLTSQQVRDIFQAADLGNHPENFPRLVGRLQRQMDIQSPPWSTIEFFLEGTRMRENWYEGRGVTTLAFDGKQVISYSEGSRTAILNTLGNNRRGGWTLQDFRLVPLLDVKEMVVERRENGVAHIKVGPVPDRPKLGGGRMAVDEATGLIQHAESRHVDGRLGYDRFQGGFRTYPGGIQFPSYSARVDYYNQGEIDVWLTLIDEAEFNTPLPDGTFTVAVGAQTNVIDHRGESVASWPKASAAPDVVQLMDSTRRVPRHPDQRSPWLLAAVLVPLAILTVWLARRWRIV
jgi:hypothetical protein